MVKEKPRQYKAELESFKSFTHRVRDLVQLKDVQQEIGGEVVFLECEDRPKVLEFYKRQKFIEFGIRVSDSEIDRGSAYPQLMRFV